MRETASGRRQAPRNVASILDAARELRIRDAHGPDGADRPAAGPAAPHPGPTTPGHGAGGVGRGH